MDIATSTARRSLREPISALVLFAGGLAWIAAFWFPVFYTSQGPVEGYWVFATGWMGFAIFQFAWYANLLLLLGIVMMYSSPLWGSALAGLGVLVATQAFWFSSIPTGEIDMPILQLGQGFWCWYGSMVLLGLGVFLGSEQVAAEKNQTTQHRRLIQSESKLKKLIPQESVSLVVAATPVVLNQTQSDAVVYETVTNPVELVPNPLVAQVVEAIPAASLPISELVSPTPFAIVPEPELPNFAELAAANEQNYFQLPNELALKPIYTEHLTEDWPPNISLVVASDPVTTEPHVEDKPAVAVEELVKPEQTKVSGLIEPEQSSVGFFDPWKP